MINISEMMYDPDFSQEYVVYRQDGEFRRGKFEIGYYDDNGVWVPGEKALQFYGPILPAKTKDIEQVPEGDRVQGMMIFYTASENPFKISRNTPEKGTSDQALWRGERYRIIQVLPCDDFGFQKAIGGRMDGD